MTDATAATESAFVIERYHNSIVEYWNGRFVDARGWETVHESALRFARREDADRVLAWLLDGGGRVAEHFWTKEAAPCQK